MVFTCSRAISHATKLWRASSEVVDGSGFSGSPVEIENHNFEEISNPQTYRPSCLDEVAPFHPLSESDTSSTTRSHNVCESRRKQR